MWVYGVMGQLTGLQGASAREPDMQKTRFTVGVGVGGEKITASICFYTA